MADEEIDSGLFNISLASFSDSEDGAGAGHQTTTTTTTNGGASTTRDRTGQTEAQFQAVRQSYRAKIENGEIWKSIQLPLGRRKVSKHEAQELLHAVEELYFYRRYDEGAALVGRMLDGEGGGEGLDRDVKELLRKYERKCLGKLGQDTS